MKGIRVQVVNNSTYGGKPIDRDASGKLTNAESFPTKITVRGKNPPKGLQAVLGSQMTAFLNVIRRPSQFQITPELEKALGPKYSADLKRLQKLSVANVKDKRKAHISMPAHTFGAMGLKLVASVNKNKEKRKEFADMVRQFQKFAEAKPSSFMRIRTQNTQFGRVPTEDLKPHVSIAGDGLSTYKDKQKKRLADDVARIQKNKEGLHGYDNVTAEAAPDISAPKQLGAPSKSVGYMANLKQYRKPQAKVKTGQPASPSKKQKMSKAIKTGKAAAQKLKSAPKGKASKSAKLGSISTVSKGLGLIESTVKESTSKENRGVKNVKASKEIFNKIKETKDHIAEMKKTAGAKGLSSTKEIKKLEKHLKDLESMLQKSPFNQ